MTLIRIVGLSLIAVGISFAQGGGGGVITQVFNVGGSTCVLSGSQTNGYVLTATDNNTACAWEPAGAFSLVVRNNGTPQGTTPNGINFVPGTGISYTMTQPGGAGTPVYVQIDNNTAVMQTLANAQAGIPNLCTSASGSGTTYTGTMNPALSAYTTGMVINWIPDVAGTGGATTLNCGGGVKSIKLINGLSDPAAGDIVPGRLTPVWYDASGNVRLIVTQKVIESKTCGASGVTAHTLVKQNSSTGAMDQLGTSDVTWYGLALSTCTSGNPVSVLRLGTDYLLIDGNVTLGNSIIASTGTAGYGHDAGGSRNTINSLKAVAAPLASCSSACAGSLLLVEITPADRGTLTDQTLIPSQDKLGTCLIDNDTQSAIALVAANFSGGCQIPRAVTVTEVDVWGGTGVVGGTLATTGTSSVRLQKCTGVAAGTCTNLLSAALATASGYACALASGTSGTCLNGATSSGTITVATAASANVTVAGDWIQLSAATPDTAQTWYRVAVHYTVN